MDVAGVAAEAVAKGVAGQRSQQSVFLTCKAWWTVSQMRSRHVLPNNWLIDSGAEISVCFDYNQFCEIGPSDVDQCVPVGSAPIDILGKGTIRVCAGKYVDFEGISRSFDLEIEDVYWVPQCPINLLATESL